jgi:hypothetical protein
MIYYIKVALCLIIKIHKMKYSLLLIFTIIILVSSFNLAKEPSAYRQMLTDIQEVNNKNFIVQQKNTLSYHTAYSSLDANDEDCNTNLAIQLSLVLSDKLKTPITISPMSIIQCYTPTNSNFVPYNCSVKFDDLDSIITGLNYMMKQINQSGLQYITTSPYIVDETTGEFPDCQTDYKNEIPFFNRSDKHQLTVELYDPSKIDDLVSIKKIIYNTGSMLGLYKASRSFIRRYINASGPFVPDTSPIDGYYALRIIGWRVLQDKLYWVFTFTREKSFGMLNYGLIDYNSSGLFLADFFEELK